MTDVSNRRERYRAGDLLIDAGARRVSRDGQRIRLPGLSFDLLLELVRAAPEVVSVDRLMDQVWSGRLVSPETVGKRATLLREALGDDPHDPRYVAVERGHGYRWLTPVEPITKASEPKAGTGLIPGAGRWRPWALSGVLAVLLLYLLNLRIELPGPATGGAGPMAGSVRALAVLPFADMSPEGNQEYFADGLAEEIIHLLAQIDSVKVIGRTSSFSFKSKNVAIPEIGKALGVDHILEGSVRTSGDRLRITAQLVRTADGSHLWSQIYDREMIDIFAIQTDVALHIAAALEAEITPAERARLERRPTDSLEAHTLYLKGRYFWNRRTGEGLANAIEYFEQAIEADPNYARAYAGLASVYGPLGVFGYAHPSEVHTRMHEAARRAVQLDDKLAEAHIVLATYLGIHSWKWAEAEREYQRAIELDPGYSRAHNFYRYYLEAQGRFEEAVAHGRLAVQLEPLVPIHYSQLGYGLWALGRLDLAEQRYREALEINPGFWLAHEGLGLLYETKGELDNAIRAFERAVRYAGPISRPKAGLARVLALTGREMEARDLLEELRAQTERNDIYTPQVASVLYALGDKDGAFEWLEAAYRQRHDNLQHIALDSGAAGLQEDPRFKDLLGRMGLPM